MVPSSISVLSSSMRLSAVGGGTNHHEGLVHSDVGHEERQKGHQHKPGRPKPLHEARHGLVQDQIAQHQFPPSARHQGLAPSELGRLRWFQLGLLHPQVGAWMEHIKGNQSHNDHSGQDSHVLPALDQVVQPCANGTHDQKESPILHQVLGHHTTITTYPIADVLTIHLVAHVILDSFDDGVEKQRRRDVEKLSRSPNVIHGQPNHFVGLHTG
mmetsp:Transcript_10092/g.22426  ORF Transcript_10092/g.22426 Transcript_10092/m.22426 type:complete len:213 (+) Transcript_10092:8-646(+)